jgi:hypothetical protein
MPSVVEVARALLVAAIVTGIVTIFYLMIVGPEGLARDDDHDCD